MGRIGGWKAAGLALACMAVALGTIGCSPYRSGSERCLPELPVAEPSSVAPGGEVTLSSGGAVACDSYEKPVDYAMVLGTEGRMPPVPIGTVIVAANGSFATKLTVPPETPPGPTHITFLGSTYDHCDDSGACASYAASFEVTAAADPLP